VTLRERLLRWHWILSTQFGFDLLRLLQSLHRLPHYLATLRRFRSTYRGRLELVPCLHDWTAEAGSTRNEYFWQDLLVARMIFAAKPQRHVDVGSRVDGFVAHVASFREIEVLDVRPIGTRVPGISFRQVDVMKPLAEIAGYCDSLSCLHALEHFGLGRYGDPIDVHGLEKGLTNLAVLLKPRGLLYLSVPIGMARVEFNAQTVSDPRVVNQFAARQALTLDGLTVIRTEAAPEFLKPEEASFSRLATERYALGLFVFRKA
jgi:hypothetical protein